MTRPGLTILSFLSVSMFSVPFLVSLVLVDFRCVRGSVMSLCECTENTGYSLNGQLGYHPVSYGLLLELKDWSFSSLELHTFK